MSPCVPGPKSTLKHIPGSLSKSAQTRVDPLSAPFKHQRPFSLSTDTSDLFFQEQLRHETAPLPHAHQFWLDPWGLCPWFILDTQGVSPLAQSPGTHLPSPNSPTALAHPGL